jgi:hypothetical protein
LNRQSGRNGQRKGQGAPAPAGATLETVDLADIQMIEGYQIRDRKVTKRDATVKAYANRYQAGLWMPPVVLARLHGSYVPVDGWHRITALRRIGRREVQAYVLRDVPPEEILWLAGQANLGHGKPLRPKEYRKVFKAYMDAGQNKKNGNGELKSYRAIVEDLGGCRSHTTIRNWMLEDYPGVASQMAGEELEPPEPRERVDRQHVLFLWGLDALGTVEKAAKSITDEKRRGEFIQALEHSLAILRGLPHILPEPPPPLPESTDF